MTRFSTAASGGRSSWRAIVISVFTIVMLLVTGTLGPTAPPIPRAHAQQATLVLWPQLAGVKVRPTTAPVAPGTTARAKGARGEGVATQVVLTNTSGTTLSGLTPQLSGLRNQNGVTIAADIQLYRVGYIAVRTPSDPGGTTTGEWPDALYPIGTDRFFHEPRNGAPFTVGPGRNQPVWIDIRIPSTAAAGTYTGTFSVTQGGGVIAQLPFELTVWDFTVPPTAKLPTTYKMFTWGAYCTHYFPGGGCQWDDQAIVGLTDRYLAEAAAHRITLDAVIYPVSYTYDDASGQLTVSNWPAWDHQLQQAGVTSFPLPHPHFDWNNPGHIWTAAETREAVALWRAAAAHYRTNGWLDRSFLYTYDEPGFGRDGFTADQQRQLVAQQSDALSQADPALRALVTSERDTFLATSAHIGIWVVPVQDLGDVATFHSVYDPERSAGKKIWWYDANGSRFAEPSGTLPDEFIDHAGVNQLVHGPLTWKYGLEGYLYYGVVEGYTTNDVWVENNYLGANGDGTLFYPGRPDKIGGTTQIPIPSIRLQLLRESWTMYDELVMLRDQGLGATADSVVNGLVTSNSVWSHDAAAYANAREQIAAALQGTPPPPPPPPSGQLALVTPLALSPASPAVNQATSAMFTVQNTGGQAVSVQYFLAGARDPSSANVDFPASAPVTLQPGQQYTYQASRSFGTAGTYTAWPAYFDGATWIELAPAHTTFTVGGTTTPGKITLVTALALSPASPAVNQATTATFTVQNTGGQPVSAQNFLAGARTPTNTNVDFPASAAVTLQPGQQYTYQASRSFTTAGTYTAWPAYFDGASWIELAPHSSFTVQSTAPLFSDSFNRTTGLGPNWTVVYGSYTTNGAMAVSGNPPINGNWAKLNTSLGTNNYAVTADVIVPAGSLFSGLVARSNDPANFDRTLYAAQIATDGNVYLYRRNDWTWTLLASAPAGIAASTSYNLKLAVTGVGPVHLEVSINGARKIAVDDSSASQIAGGAPGMENYDAGVKYDNFTVNAP